MHIFFPFPKQKALFRNFHDGDCDIKNEEHRQAPKKFEGNEL